MGCGTTHPPYNYASEPDPRKSEYVLGSSDIVKITVWRNPDLSTDATVLSRRDHLACRCSGIFGRRPHARAARAEIIQRLGTF